MPAPLLPGQVLCGPRGHTLTVERLQGGLAHCTWADGHTSVLDAAVLASWDLVSGPEVAPAPTKPPQAQAASTAAHQVEEAQALKRLPPVDRSAASRTEPTCSHCHAPLGGRDLMRVEGVCSIACYQLDASRRARLQDPYRHP